MGGIVIISPYAPTQSMGSGPSGPDYSLAPRLFTPNPKEAFSFPASSTSYNIDIDLGSAMPVDSLYVGYHNAVANNQTVTLQALGNYGNLPVNATPLNQYPLPSLGIGSPGHSFNKAGAPTLSRYWRFGIRNAGDNPVLTIGVLALGLAFQPVWGHEYGAGRLIEDTGTAERLFGGGFGIDDGVSATGYQWTLGDLQPDEVQQLYQLIRNRRTTRTVLVVEDPDQTAGLGDRTHWGTLGKLEAYERIDPKNTKWSLSIRDWA